MISGERNRISKIIIPTLSQEPRTVEIGDASIELIAGVPEGDDCAVYDLGPNLSMVLGMDYVRGESFYLFQEGIMNHYDLGYYLVIANLSDVASMGVRPAGLVTTVRYPEHLTDEQFRDIFIGMNEAAQKYGAVITGGDIGGANELVLSAAAYGFCEKGKYLLRSEAKENDLVCVTGCVGIPVAALVYFRKLRNEGITLNNELQTMMANSWRRPNAKVQEGLLLAESGLGHACQDISDGLKVTIEQISEASQKRIVIYEEQLPIHECVVEVARYLGISPTHLALGISVDFELLFTLDPKDLDRCQRLFEEEETSFYIIGKVEDSGSNQMINKKGKVVEIPGYKWDQAPGDVVEMIVRESKKVFPD